MSLSVGTSTQVAHRDFIVGVDPVSPLPCAGKTAGIQTMLPV